MSSIILEEDLDHYEPTHEEIVEYSRWLGIDPDIHQELLWIARDGLKAPLPSGWKACKSDQDEIYYWNSVTGESIWDHPRDEEFKKLAREEIKKLELSRAKGQSRSGSRIDSPSSQSSYRSPSGASSLGPSTTSGFSSSLPKSGKLNPLGGKPILNPIGSSKPLGAIQTSFDDEDVLSIPRTLDNSGVRDSLPNNSRMPLPISNSQMSSIGSTSSSPLSSPGLTSKLPKSNPLVGGPSALLSMRKKDGSSENLTILAEDSPLAERRPSGVIAISSAVEGLNTFSADLQRADEEERRQFQKKLEDDRTAWMNQREKEMEERKNRALRSLEDEYSRYVLEIRSTDRDKRREFEEKMKVDYDMFAKSLADSYTNKRSEILKEKENSENLTRQIEVMEAEQQLELEKIRERFEKEKVQKTKEWEEELSYKLEEFESDLAAKKKRLEKEQEEKMRKLEFDHIKERKVKEQEYQESLARFSAELNASIEREKSDRERDLRDKMEESLSNTQEQLESERRERWKEKLESLNVQIDSLPDISSLQTDADIIRELRNSITTTRNQLEAEHSTLLAEFSRQTEQLRNRHNDELTDCTASHQRKMDALRASLSQELSEFEIRERERRQDEILQSLRQELSQFEASQKDLFAKKREEVKKHVSDLTNESIEIDQQEIELAKKKAQLKSDFENQIESIQNDGETRLQQERRVWEDRIAILRRKFEEEETSEREKLSSLFQRNAEAKEKAIRDHSDQLSRLEADMRSSQMKLTAELERKASEEREKIRSSLDTYERECSKKRDELRQEVEQSRQAAEEEIRSNRQSTRLDFEFNIKREESERETVLRTQFAERLEKLRGSFAEEEEQYRERHRRIIEDLERQLEVDRQRYNDLRLQVESQRQSVEQELMSFSKWPRLKSDMLAIERAIEDKRNELQTLESKISNRQSMPETPMLIHQNLQSPDRSTNQVFEESTPLSVSAENSAFSPYQGHSARKLSSSQGKTPSLHSSQALPFRDRTNLIAEHGSKRLESPNSENLLPSATHPAGSVLQGSNFISPISCDAAGSPLSVASSVVHEEKEELEAVQKILRKQKKHIRNRQEALRAARHAWQEDLRALENDVPVEEFERYKDAMKQIKVLMEIEARQLNQEADQLKVVENTLENRETYLGEMEAALSVIEEEEFVPTSGKALSRENNLSSVVSRLENLEANMRDGFVQLVRRMDTQEVATRRDLSSLPLAPSFVDLLREIIRKRTPSESASKQRKHWLNYIPESILEDQTLYRYPSHPLYLDQKYGRIRNAVDRWSNESISARQVLREHANWLQQLASVMRPVFLSPSRVSPSIGRKLSTERSAEEKSGVLSSKLSTSRAPTISRAFREYGSKEHRQQEILDHNAAIQGSTHFRQRRRRRPAQMRATSSSVVPITLRVGDQTLHLTLAANPTSSESPA